MFNPDVIEYYNKNANKYYEERVLSGGSLFNEFIEMPAVLELLNNNIENKNILDIGCGFGLYSKILSEKGGKVTALDSSKEMIKYAKTVCSNTDVNFVLEPFQNYIPDSKIIFDIILGSFMLGYFDNLESIFSRISNLLSPVGSCIMSMLHPLRLSSIRDKNGVYSIDDYFDSNSVYTSDFLKNNEILFLKKWTISDISHAASISGLLIDLIIEPKPDKLPAKYNTQKIEYLKRCPSVIIFKFVHNHL